MASGRIRRIACLIHVDQPVLWTWLTYKLKGFTASGFTLSFGPEDLRVEGKGFTVNGDA